MPQERAASENAPRILLHALLILLNLAVYAQTLEFGFVDFDDTAYSIDNPHIQAPLAPRTIAWAFTTGYFANWHPLTWLSYMIDWRLFGPWAGGSHAVNVLFHILNSCLLFELLRRMTGASYRAAFVAALFAVHPLHVESVAWIAERKDVLSTFFGFLALLAHGAYVARPGYRRYVSGIALFALALMAKPMWVTLPFLLLLLDYWPLQRFDGCRDRYDVSRRLGGLISEKLPHFVLAVAVSVITIAAQRNGALVALDAISFKARLCNALVSYAAYVLRTFWPARLAVFYPYPGEGICGWRMLAACGMLLVVTGLAFALLRRRPYVAVGWFWYLGALAPVIGIIQVGRQAMADRYAYLPSVGLFVIAAWALGDSAAKGRIRRRVASAFAAFAVIALTAAAGRQTAFWHDGESLFRHTVRVTENNVLAYNCLGLALAKQDRADDAERAYRQALVIDPDYAKALTNLGNLLSRRGADTEAEACLRKAVASDPSDASAHYNLALLLADSGRRDEAVAEYRETIRLNDGFSLAYNNLGNLLAASGQIDEAIAAFRRALDIAPGLVKARVNLGNAYAGRKRFAEAIDCYEKALRLEPNQANAHLNLGNALAESGQFDEAAVHFARVLELEPENGYARQGIERVTALGAIRERQGPP